MRTINGKLITQDKQQFDKLKHETARMMETYQDLETQIMNLSQQKEDKYSQEIEQIKTHLTQLDKRCILLEESITRQFIQFIVINICSILGVILLWHWFAINNQPTPPKNNQPIHHNKSKTTSLLNDGRLNIKLSN